MSKKLLGAMNATTCNTMDSLGFICVDQLCLLNGDVSEDENVWVWKHPNGTTVTMYDEGNEKLSFVDVLSAGTEEGTQVRNVKPKDMLVTV